MMLPDPGVLDRLIQDRQRHLRVPPQQSQARSRAALRVRVGHLLIAAGAALSGERVEVPARRPAFPKPV